MAYQHAPVHLCPLPLAASAPRPRACAAADLLILLWLLSAILRTNAHVRKQISQQRQDYQLHEALGAVLYVALNTGLLLWLTADRRLWRHLALLPGATASSVGAPRLGRGWGNGEGPVEGTGGWEGPLGEGDWKVRAAVSAAVGARQEGGRHSNGLAVVVCGLAVPALSYG